MRGRGSAPLGIVSPRPPRARITPQLNLGVMPQPASSYEPYMHDWPFADPPNQTSYSTRGVMECGEPILLVAHEEDDGSWQFVGAAWEAEDLVVVCLSHAVDLDRSLRDLADLPRGWVAEREAIGAPWRRYEALPDAEE